MIKIAAVPVLLFIFSVGIVYAQGSIMPEKYNDQVINDLENIDPIDFLKRLALEPLDVPRGVVPVKQKAG